MLDYAKDEEATMLARFESDRSYVTIAGHRFLRGLDKTELWERVYRDQRGLCAACWRWAEERHMDLHHIIGKRPKMRCDCYHTRLTDGSLHTNVEIVHTMDPAKGIMARCHMEKHGRFIGGRSHEDVADRGL